MLPGVSRERNPPPKVRLAMQVNPDVEIACSLAAQEARRRRHDLLTVEHLLFALLHDKTARHILMKSGADLDQLRSSLDRVLNEELPAVPEGPPVNPNPSRGFQRVLQRAALHVESSGKVELLPQDLLVAIFSEVDTLAVTLLEEAHVTRVDVISYIAHGMPASSGSANVVRTEGEEEDGIDALPGSGSEDDPLERFASNLNERARLGQLEPLIGRETELRRSFQILARRKKNNPLLVGDAGVGKTAIVEGLASRIQSGDVPDPLKNATIWALDMGTLIAGTKFRGDFENRLKGIVRSIESRPGSILFLDEIHTVMGAGATGGSTLDAANLLKPLLTSGTVRCIGATTFEEYRQHIERDRPLARRFQKLEVEEPDEAHARSILAGLVPNYEQFHEVTYTSEALDAAVTLAARHLTDRKLPDKAIDVIDEAGADARLEMGGGATVEINRIEAIVARMAKIPPRQVSQDDREALRNLSGDLKRTVFGQERAIDDLACAIKLARAGLRSPGQPIGCYLFTGPTGVGKTEVARQLAAALGVELLRFDMSEYMERHTVSRLIGAPPGYVGHDRGGLLTEAVAKTPHAVLLLDEIEKAHPDVFNVLLQIMDHGALTDANGKKSDFRNVILIMTSNVGAADLARPLVGFGTRDRRGRDDIAYKNTFSPEFRNRLDARIAFEPLTVEVMELVVDKFMAELGRQLSDRNVTISVLPAARKDMAIRGHDPDFGARPLSRLIQEELKRPLAEALLFGELSQGGSVRIDSVDGKLTMKFDPAVTAAS